MGAWNGDWLTPDNFQKGKAKDGGMKNPKAKKVKLRDAKDEGRKGENTTSSVAVITRDTAMQKAMMSLGLRVLTTAENRHYGDRNEPTDIQFRCYGCYTFEKNTNRTHCRHCGGQTFQRVQIYTDEWGKQHYRYSARDRFGHRYLDKHNLVPRGQQLVKYEHKPFGQGRQRKKGRAGRRQQLGNQGGRW